MNQNMDDKSLGRLLQEHGEMNANRAPEFRQLWKAAQSTTSSRGTGRNPLRLQLTAAAVIIVAIGTIATVAYRKDIAAHQKSSVQANAPVKGREIPAVVNFPTDALIADVSNADAQNSIEKLSIEIDALLQ